jgi:Protein of unknown function (DUF2637)
VHLPQLRRVRWAVRAALTLGVSASVAANVLHARPNPISETIAGWPPLALLLTVELISRVPMHKLTLAFLRFTATAAIAGIAAWVSYWHMADVASRYGEAQISAYLLPISVDGLIVVASVCLVELGGRIRMVEDEERALAMARATGSAMPGRAVAPSLVPQFRPAPVPVDRHPELDRVPNLDRLDLADLDDFDELDPDQTPDNIPVSPAVGPLTVPISAKEAVLSQRPATGVAEPRHNPRPRTATSRAMSASPRKSTTATIYTRTPGGQPAQPIRAMPPAQRTAPGPATPSPSASAGDSAPPATTAHPDSLPRQRRPSAETAAMVARIQAQNPNITPAELAEQLGISQSRLRAVRRELSTSTAA